MKKLFTIAFAAFAFTANAQNLNTHYLYQLNWFNINPAYTGETEGLKAIINPGTQWVGLDGSPTNSMFGIHGGVNDNVGIGGKLIIDKRGIFTNMTAELLYAYKVDLTEDQKINFGISAGVYNSSLDQNTIFGDKYTDPTDPTLTSVYYNETQFIGSFGALYKYKDLNLGLSLPHLIVSGRPISDHIFGTARYDFLVLEDRLKLSPLFVFQHLTKSPNMFDLGARFEWEEMIWAQLAYRTNKTTAAALGVNIRKFELGYLYNINSTPLNVISSGSHEVFISFTFDKKIRSTDNTSRLSSIIDDLKSLDRNNPDVDAEIKDLQKELGDLLQKMENGTYTEADDARLKELEDRIGKLKKAYKK